MANRLFKNHATTTLAANITSGATSLTVATGDGAKFASPSGNQFFLFTLETGTIREICKCTSRSGDTFSVIVRAQEGTAAVGWTAGDKVEQRWTADSAQRARYDDEPLGVATEQFRAVYLRTHPDADQAASKVMLVRADGITMSDGAEATNWERLVADITLSGAGGLDTGSEQADTWYEVHAIQKSTDLTKNLLLHRAKDYFLDEISTSGEDGQHLLRDAAARTRLGQGFKVDTAGALEKVNIKVAKIGTPTGRFWLTIESDSGGLPSGTILATSDKYDVARLPTTAALIELPFRNPFTTVAGTQYHIVMQGDFTISGTNHMLWRADTTAATYANGAKAAYDGTTWTTDADDDCIFQIWITRNETAIVMPSGYDRRCLLDYIYNNSSSNFKPFSSAGRRTITAMGPQWRVGALSTTLTTYDLKAFLPPRPVQVTFAVGLNTSYGATLGHISSTDITGAVVDAEWSSPISANAATSGASVPGQFLYPLLVEYAAVLGISGTAPGFWVQSYAW